MSEDEAAERARQRALVRRGYDAVSQAYRDDGGQTAEAGDIRYAGWVAELAERLRPGARAVDLGCGAGIPATRELTDRGLQVIGVDFSAVQLGRGGRRAQPHPGPGLLTRSSLRFVGSSRGHVDRR